MEKIEIKLKDCCLTCEHFCLDTSSIGCYSACGLEERKIACIHMMVCQTYNGHKLTEVVSCGQCKRWCADETYGTGLTGKKERYGTCDITKLACKENHFCGYGRWRRYERKGNGKAKLEVAPRSNGTGQL